MFKDWKAICQITDAHFLWALAMLDLATDFGRMIVERLPEYFTNEQQTGPYPLSMLRSLASKEAREHGGGNGGTDCLVSYKKYWHREFNIPLVSFSTAEDNGFDDPMLPTEIDSQIEVLGRRAEVGDIFTWEGKEIILLENNDDKCGSCFLMYFAPAKLIVVDK